ncbi:hypothetical protein [Algibacter sp.]|uniref:hypothetical protein n=1 Tax=Algibacter sp. TaxID=1872428 RepID=UPI003C7626C9
MKNLIFICTLLLFTNAAIAQEKQVDIKEESEIKTVKVKDAEKTTEKKLKVITRETTSIELDENDKNKVNQERVNATSKVEKMIMADNDDDDDYDVLTSETYYKIGEENYLFKPSNRGFDIAFKKNESVFVPIEKALNTNANGHYLVKGDTYSGIGYFNKVGHFVIQYYDEKMDSIETKTYIFAETND